MQRLGIVCIILAVVLIPCLAGASDEVTGWSIEADNKIGGATYQEKEVSIDSNWTTFYYEGIVAVDYFKEKGLIGRIDFGMPLTASGEETWDINTKRYQTNDMSFWGMESNVELGYAFPVVADKWGVAPLGRYGFSFTRFTRTNFNVLNIITSTAIVDEDYWVQHIDMGGKFFYKVNDKLNFDIKGLFGFVVYNSAHNSVLGTINGGGGYMTMAETNINYNIYKTWSIAGGGFFGLQYLKGGTSGNMLWPNNYLYSYGGKINLKYTF